MDSFHGCTTWKLRGDLKFPPRFPTGKIIGKGNFRFPTISTLETLHFRCGEIVDRPVIFLGNVRETGNFFCVFMVETLVSDVPRFYINVGNVRETKDFSCVFMAEILVSHIPRF